MNGLEPWLSEMIEEGLAPHRGVVSPEELDWMRQEMIERLAADPDLARLARDARPRIPTEESGQAVQKDVLEGLTDEQRAAVAARRA
jgi:hypothetical protein